MWAQEERDKKRPSMRSSGQLKSYSGIIDVVSAIRELEVIAKKQWGGERDPQSSQISK